MYAATRQICSLFKLRIGVAITLSALAGLAVTPGPAPSAWQIAALALAVFLSAASAGAFNQYAERDLDALMARTRDRPFVTGAYRPGALWLGIIVAILVAAVVLAATVVNAIAAVHVVLGAVVYGIVYTVWLKRRSWTNIVVGGLSGSFAVLAGAAAVDPVPGVVPILFAVVLFLWTPPHFWSLATALRDDYARAGVPMLPVVVGDAAAARVILAHTVVLVAGSLAPAAYGLGPVYLASAAIGGAWFIAKSIALVRAPGRATAMANFHASLGQLSLVIAGAFADVWLFA